jgi:hypothetical protein
MNSKLMAPGTGGASAVLLIWWLNSQFGIQATAEQTAALATGLSVVYGFFDEIVSAVKDVILAALKSKRDAVADEQAPKEGSAT